MSKEFVGNKKFLELDKKLSVIFPPRTKKATVDYVVIGKLLNVSRGYVNCQYVKKGRMTVGFYEKLNNLTK